MQTVPAEQIRSPVPHASDSRIKATNCIEPVVRKGDVGAVLPPQVEW